MADLTGTTPADTYKGLLQVNDYTDGVDATAKYIQDGEGTDSALAISTDNVGIGTASPDANVLLHVQGKVGTTNGEEADPTHTFYSDPDTGMFRAAVDTLAFSTGGVEKMRIDSAGNVGIGTTSPDAPLHIVGTPASTLILERDSADVTAISSIILKDGSDDQVRISSTDSKLLFETGASNTPRMLVGSDGNVGIGTTSPSDKLEVEGQIRTSLGITFSDTGLIQNNTTNLQIATVTANKDIVLSPHGSGNVGIGTTNFGTNAAGVIGIANATAPTSSPADMVQLYAEDVTASSELRVRDEAGNVTTLSPHAKDAPDSLYDNGKGVDEMHRVANHYLGTIVFTNVDRRNDLMQKQLNGEELPEDRTFKVTETFAEYNARTGADLQVEDWDANQQAMFDAQEEKVAARQAEIDAWDNEEEEAPEPLQSYVKKPKPDWLS